jgi:hypothetical protein
MTRSRDIADQQENLGGAVAPFVGAKNIIGNGGLDFWQRGTTFTNVGPGTYTADRWSVTSTGTGVNTTITQDTVTPNASIKYAIKYQQVTNASTSITEWRGRQFIEVGFIRPLQGKLVTTSFWYKSNLTGNHAIRLGIYQANGTNLDSLQSFSYPTANVWQYVSVTHSCLVTTTGWTVAENQPGAFLDVGPSQSSYAINDYFEFTNMQLESGSAATPFTRAGGTYNGELALCQRYATKLGGEFAYTWYGTGVNTTSANASIFVSLPVKMRTAPTLTVPSANYFYVGTAGTTPTAIFINTASAQGVALSVTTSGMTANNGTQLYGDSSLNSYLLFTSEL